MPDITIIIPHKPTLANDEALKLNIQMLLDNTRCSFELIVDTQVPKDPYKIWNEAVAVARSKVVVLSNSDVLMAPDWDVPILEHICDNVIVTGYLVEPGVIGVAPANIRKDFGKLPSEFDRTAFEEFAREDAKEREEIEEKRAWYMPCAMMRDWFMWTGGFNTDKPFPEPNDIKFWDRVVQNYSTKLLRVPSYAYHFQNLSGRL